MKWSKFWYIYIVLHSFPILHWFSGVPLKSLPQTDKNLYKTLVDFVLHYFVLDATKVPLDTPHPSAGNKYFFVVLIKSKILHIFTLHDLPHFSFILSILQTVLLEVWSLYLFKKDIYGDFHNTKFSSAENIFALPACWFKELPVNRVKRFIYLMYLSIYWPLRSSWWIACAKLQAKINILAFRMFPVLLVSPD